MLQAFTLRSVTVPDDRLCAVQSVANELLWSCHITDNLPKTYLAGTWAACLPQQLLWCRSHLPILCLDGTDPNGSQLSMKRSSRAPSWSWACLDCPVLFSGMEDEETGGTFSLSEKPSKPPCLEFECNILCRSLDEFKRDRSTASDVLIIMDLNEDELGPRTMDIYYLLFLNISARVVI